MDNYLISIIIPVYNTSKYLEKCINSLVNQTYKNIELIFVNDGSTDDSLEILNKYANTDKRIKVISQKNKGLSQARNTGLSCAAGDYIMFLDSDDWIDTAACKKAVETASEYNADIVMWSYIREYENKSKTTLLFDDKIKTWNKNNISNIYKRMIGPTKEELKNPEKIDSIVTAWGKIYKKDAIENIRFVDTKIIQTEDTLFNILVFSKIKSAVYLPNTFSHYRKDNECSLTYKYKKSLPLQRKELFRIIKNHLDKTNASSEYYEALNNRICLSLISLGIMLTNDANLSFNNKYKELKNVFKMSPYKYSLKKFRISYLPIHWKVFFLLAKTHSALLLILLLDIINFLRKN